MNAKRLTELLEDREGCYGNIYSSRICEYGVKSCEVRHRTYDNANDIAFAIGKLEEMGLLVRV